MRRLLRDSCRAALRGACLRPTPLLRLSSIRHPPVVLMRRARSHRGPPPGPAAERRAPLQTGGAALHSSSLMSEIHIQEGQYPGGAISWDRPRRTAAGLTAVGGGFTRPRAAQPLAATAKTRYMSAADDRLGRVLRQLVASAGAPPPPAAASAATATTTPRLRVARSSRCTTRCRTPT